MEFHSQVAKMLMSESAQTAISVQSITAKASDDKSSVM